MKTFLIAAAMALLSIGTANAMDEFRNKPVICSADKDEMIYQLNQNDMIPLLGVNGVTFGGTSDQGNMQTFPAYLIVAWHPTIGKVSFIEFHQDGWACLLGGSRNGVEFDPAEIGKMLGWKEIQ